MTGSPCASQIALALHGGGGSASIQHVARVVARYAAAMGEVCELPAEWQYATPSKRRTLALSFIKRCELLMGFASVLTPLLEAREQLGRAMPCLVFVLGGLPRGGGTIRALLPYLRTSDVIIVNSQSDECLARQFVENATVCRVPLPYDEAAFTPMTPEERCAARHALGFADQDLCLLYAGRLVPEKNIHTLLRLISVVAQTRGEVRLVLAGQAASLPIPEFGVECLDYEATLLRMCRELGVHVVTRLGPVDQAKLRMAYAASDVLLNFTLHHDENWGLSQVEAAACGTPALASAWGGLHDTICPGINGRLVATFMSPIGPKVNWAEALEELQSICERRQEWQAMRDTCVEHARRVHGFTAFESAMARAVRLAQERRGIGTRLQVTCFAQDFWTTCVRRGLGYPMYAVNTPSFSLYRALMMPYVEPRIAPATPSTPRSNESLLMLVAPLSIGNGDCLSIDDPLGPHEIAVPPKLIAGVWRVLDRLMKRPLLARSQLTGAPWRRGEINRAIGWLIEQGIVTLQHPTAFPRAQQAADWRMAKGILRFERSRASAYDFRISARSD